MDTLFQVLLVVGAALALLLVVLLLIGVIHQRKDVPLANAVRNGHQALAEGEAVRETNKLLDEAQQAVRDAASTIVYWRDQYDIARRGSNVGRDALDQIRTQSSQGANLDALVNINTTAAAALEAMVQIESDDSKVLAHVIHAMEELGVPVDPEAARDFASRLKTPLPTASTARSGA